MWFWKLMTKLDDLIVHGLSLDNNEIGFRFCQWSWAGLTRAEDKELFTWMGR